MRARHIHLSAILLQVFLVVSCGVDDNMRERLSYVIACNRADTVFTSKWLPTVDSLARYFSRHGTVNDRLMAYYLQGRVHQDMGEAPQALECYQRASEQADTTRRDCDLYTLYAVYGQMAVLFKSQYLADDAMQALKSSERVAWKDHDTIAALKAFELRTGPYYLKSDTDSVMLILEQSYRRYMQLGLTKQAAILLPVVINISIDRQQYDSISSYFKIYEGKSDRFDSDGNLKFGGIYYYDKGRYALYRNMADSALIYFHKALKSGFPEAAYKGMLSVYEKKHIADSIAKYARLFADANDYSYYHVNQDKVRQINAMYNYNRQRQLAEQNIAKARKFRWWFFTAAMLAVAVTAIAVYMIKHTRRKAEERYMRVSEEYERAKERLANSIEWQRLIGNERETDISAPHDSGVRMSVYPASEMESRSQEIKELREKVDSLEKQLMKFSSVNMESAFKRTKIYKRFVYLTDVKNMREHPTEEDWEELTDGFSSHFVRYYAFITLDNRLPVNQLRYCMLARLGFDGTDIGILMDIDKDQRYNLRKLIYETLFGNPVKVKTLDKKLRHYF